jgi:hypothetical protein
MLWPSPNSDKLAKVNAIAYSKRVSPNSSIVKKFGKKYITFNAPKPKPTYNISEDNIPCFFTIPIALLDAKSINY